MRGKELQTVPFSIFPFPSLLYLTPSHCSWYVGTGTEYSIQFEKFDILAYIATPYKYCFIIFSTRGVVEISKIVVF